ncbi:hypothetical protein [Xenophilus sp. Marseille-Q4582]|uniref:hypothetical protein n=1 Tax=Xenophilus sp. Marseille-Q4582 TaxID=2866600 RepID=UPI001CE44946|nr:hypothetical protein [Xenophilus sp. Marseille-Q4582]
MSKTSWIVLVIVIAAATGGGAYYVVQQRTLEEPAQVAPAAPAAPVEPQKAPPDDLTKKKLDGIGSTRNLKPVQIPQGPAK